VDESKCVNTRKKSYNSYCQRTNMEMKFVPADGLRRLLRLMTAASEFHSSNVNQPTTTKRTVQAVQSTSGRGFKGVVVLFLQGGVDSFNLLVPHSDCGATDLYKEYSDIRGNVALSKADLLGIDVPAGTQPCKRFGVHPAMPKVKKLYDEGDAAFIANAGAMVEPMTKSEYLAKSKQLPPSLFAHNVMQRSAQTVHAQYASSDGVLGRIIQALQSQASSTYKTASFSISGNKKILDGGSPPDIMHSSQGVIRYDGYQELGGPIHELLGVNQSSSIFADTHAELVLSALERTEALGAILDNVTLTQSFGTDQMSRQLQQVATLVAARERLGIERGAFVTALGGFDTHSSLGDSLAQRLAWIDTAVDSFAREMKAQGAWDDIAILTISDFGRTLTSNGLGTDHAWGGNYMLMGGGVNGGQILGQFPQSLKEDSDLNLGRGRVLPTTPWEAPWYGLAQWLGVATARMQEVLPNLKNFPGSHLFTKDQMFKATV